MQNAAAISRDGHTMSVTQAAVVANLLLCVIQDAVCYHKASHDIRTDYLKDCLSPIVTNLAGLGSFN